MFLRCSSLPTVARCAQSIWPDPRPDNQASREGTAVHELMAEFLTPGGGYSSVEEVCEEMKLDPAKVGMLYGLTRKCWSQVETWFPGPQSEVYLEAAFGDLVLTGHIDVLSLIRDNTEAHICDHKTGFLDADREAQQRGYAWLVFRNYPTVNTVRSCVLRPRHQECEWNVWTREDAATWMTELSKHIDQREYKPSPETCQYCPRLAHAFPPCVPGQNSMRATVDAIMYADDVQDHVKAVQHARIIKKKCEEIEAWGKAAAESAGGKISGDGMDLVLTPTDRETILFTESEPILRNVLGSELPNVVQVGKGKLEDALRAKAGRGKGAKLIREVFEQLNDIGAIEIDTTYRLELKRQPKQIPQEVQA